MNIDYQIFFDLRVKYPNYKKLISKLMAVFFENNDSFPSMILIEGLFKKDDIELIFSSLGLSLSKSSNCRNIHDNEKMNSHTRIWFG